MSEKEYTEKEEVINGWQYYRSTNHGKMVAYHRSAGEQLIFTTDEAFRNWLEAEMNE